MGFSLGDLNPVKAIDKALVGLDKSVKNVGGWEVVGPATAALIAAPYVYPYLAGSTAGGGFGLTASQVPNLAAGLGATGGTVAGTGATGFGLAAPAAGYTFGELSASQVPTLASNLGLGSAATAGLTGAQKAMLLRTGLNAVNQLTGGSQIGDSYGGGGTSRASGYDYASLPFLANPQYNQVFMKTGPDVSGSGITTAGMPVQLDTTRHNILMANLLRG